MSNYGHIDAKALKSLIDTDVPMVVLDARSKKWDDGRRIPNAQSLTPETAPEVYAETIPDKESLVAVYCGGGQCPAGAQVVKNLRNAGYTNVMEYSGGIKEWADVNNYPIERI